MQATFSELAMDFNATRPHHAAHDPPTPAALRRPDPLRREHGAAGPRRRSASARGTCSTRAWPSKTGLSFGTVVILTSALVLLAWIPLRQKPGIGTVSNVFVLGVVVDSALRCSPATCTASATSSRC